MEKDRNEIFFNTYMKWYCEQKRPVQDMMLRLFDVNTNLVISNSRRKVVNIKRHDRASKVDE